MLNTFCLPISRGAQKRPILGADVPPRLQTNDIGPILIILRN